MFYLWPAVWTQNSPGRESPKHHKHKDKRGDLVWQETMGMHPAFSETSIMWHPWGTDRAKCTRARHWSGHLWSKVDYSDMMLQADHSFLTCQGWSAHIFLLCTNVSEFQRSLQPFFFTKRHLNIRTMSCAVLGCNLISRKTLGGRPSSLCFTLHFCRR